MSNNHSQHSTWVRTSPHSTWARTSPNKNVVILEQTHIKIFSKKNWAFESLSCYNAITHTQYF